MKLNYKQHPNLKQKYTHQGYLFVHGTVLQAVTYTALQQYTKSPCG